MTTLQAIAQAKAMTRDEELELIKLELAKIKAENQALIHAQQSKLKLKVSEKGGLSVYGLGRFPVTLYKSQWLALISFIETIHTFIKANDSLLKEKE